MALGEYLLGLLILAGTWGSSLGIAWMAVVRLTPRLLGAPRALAFALFATAALVLAELLPAMLGVLSRWSALAAALALLLIVYRFLPRAPGAPEDDIPRAAWESSVVSWAIAAVGVAAVAVWSVAKLWAATREASHDIDTLTFHLPVVGRWLETGSIWQVDQYTPLLANGNYPHNGDLVFTSVVAAFDSDAFVGAVGVPFLGVAALSVYAIARELAAPRATAVLAAALLVALPVATEASFAGAKTDAIAWACFGAGTLFMLRHLRLGHRGDLILAGLGIGLTLGTKWYGASAAAVMVAVWAGAGLLRRRGAAAVLRDGAVLVGVIALAGGFWLVRNAIESGSPLNPVGVPPIWDTPRDFVRECSGFRIVDYVGDGRIWADYVYPAYRDNYALAGVFLVVGWLAAAVLAARRRHAGAMTLVVASGLLALAYASTPYSALGAENEPLSIGANTRWVVPALLMAAALWAWAAGPLGRLRPVAEGVALIAVVTGLERGADVPAHTAAAAAVALVAAGAAGYGVLLLSRRVGRGRLVPIGACGLALVALLAIAYDRQRDYYSDRFANFDDPVVSQLANTKGQRIAIAGVSSVNGIAPMWPAFGPRLDNHVEFLGPTIDGQLNEYDDRREWTRAIERGRFDLLVVGRGGYGPDCPLPGRETDDDAWARAAGFRRLAGTERLTLYSVR